MDEFHTLFHARSADLAALVESCADDNHPPLSFALVHVSRAAFGEGSLALRTPSLLAGVLALALVLILGARLLGSASGSVAENRGALWALAFAAVAPQAVMASSEARMYGLLGACLLALALAVERAERTGRLPLWAAPVLSCALLTHYFAWHHLAVAALVVVSVPTVRRRATGVLANPRSIAVVAGGLLLAAPWYAFGFVRQLEHGLWPGRGAAGLRAFVDSFGGLSVRRLDLAPPWLALWATLAAGGLLLLAVLGWRRVRAVRPVTAALLLAQVFVLPVWAAVASHLFARSGFDPKYLSASGLALVVLAGIGLASLPRPSWRAVLGLLVAVPLALQSFLVASDPGAEDYRGATARAVELCVPGVPFAPIEWQPALFPHAQGFRYEVERLEIERGFEPEFEWLEHDAYYGLAEALDARPADAPPLVGLVVAVRGLPESHPLWSRLAARFGPSTVERFGGLRLVRYGVAAR
ncbi:hypothetical protein [Rohdeia mirabilis]|uniref:hypothetical protein n=1 Tax=Rohdeia mirabilis TaxID=2528008 RepID=UPI003AF3D438